MNDRQIWREVFCCRGRISAASACKEASRKSKVSLPMEAFNYDVPAELFPARKRKYRRQPFGYRRFARAADAIRFAIEEMPAQLLESACLEVDDVRFDGEGIRR